MLPAIPPAALLMVALATAAAPPRPISSWLLPNLHVGDRIYVLSMARSPRWDEARSLGDLITQGAYDIDSVDGARIGYTAREPLTGPITVHGTFDLERLIDVTDDPEQPPDGTEFDMPVYSAGFYGMPPPDVHAGSTWTSVTPAWEFGSAGPQAITATEVDLPAGRLSLLVHGEGTTPPADESKREVWSDAAHAFLPLRFSHVDWTLNVTFIDGLLTTCDVVMHTRGVTGGNAPYAAANWNSTYFFYETATYVPAALNKTRTDDSSDS